ncbi:MAG: ABC transporter permease [Rhizobiaceae bacterium]
MLSVLDRKVMRDLLRLWAQVLAIALVLACGVMTIILAVGAYRSLDETRRTYYDRYRFANVFVQAVRIPGQTIARIAAIDGVMAVSARIAKPVILDIEGMAVPATGLALSLPANGNPAVNGLFLRSGRLPVPGRVNEVALDERFAKAHGFHPGDRFRATLSGRKLELEISGIVLSPEFVYALGPGDMVPDDKRYAVFHMGEAALAGIAGMDNAYNDIALRLMRGANLRRVMEEVDAVLEPYGGSGSYGRSEQMSHAYLDGELTQLYAMARVLPPVFLFVSAFLVNMILSRLVALEREQIGLLKACGYSSLAVALHYTKFVIVIALIGMAIGSLVGNWTGQALTRLYGQFFSFPFLIFKQSADLYIIAAAVTVSAALAGAAKAIWAVVTLPPAVAMRPPAPQRYRRFAFLPTIPVSRLTLMAFRQISHRPLRAALTTLGVAFAVALLVTSLFTRESIEAMIDTVFFKAERADARLAFSADKPPSVLFEVARLPGVLSVEGFRSVPVILRNKHHEKRIAIIGRETRGRLSRVLDADGGQMTMPGEGLLLSDRLAHQLRLQRGMTVEVELIESGHRIERVPVAGTVRTYVGLAANMNIDALDRLAGNGPRLSGAWLEIDERRLAHFSQSIASAPPGMGGRWPMQAGATGITFPVIPLFLYDTIKATPAIGSIAMQTLSRDKFRETIEQNIDVSMAVYAIIAMIVAFGVVYNSARIQLSERGRELASLRVLGFNRVEAASVLLVELGVIVGLAQPLGWLIGFAFALSMVEGFSSDLFSIPLVIEPRTYALSSLIVLAAAAVSALLVARRVANLDLIRVLKTRE